MTVSISFSSKQLESKATLVLGVQEGNALPQITKDWDTKTGGTITKALAHSRFKGKVGDTLAITAPSGIDASRVILAGLGKNPSENDLNKVVGNVFKLLSAAPDTEANIEIDLPIESLAHIAGGLKIRSWTFDKYYTKKKDDEKVALKNITFVASDDAALKKAYQKHEQVAEGIFLTREVVSEPPNIIYPETLATECKALEKDGITVEILDEKEMEKLGMGALLGVGHGSVCDSKLVVMQWNGAKDKSEQPVAFVGKGVTFDTGGISIKPAGGMEDMKWDMGGAGTVIGLMKSLACRKAQVNVVGIVGLVENMPSGSAQRPGDVVTTMSGQTIEVLNTDAEGRLVLADALWYTQDRFKPQFIVDLATLTGAIIVCLGHDRAGLFSNNDDLAKKLEKAGDATGELLWRLPTDKSYDKDIDSDIADMKNIGSGRGAGSTTAAMLLQRFVNGTPWAHLDIAGTAWSTKDLPLSEKGATAFGVRLLDRLVRDNYEGK